MGSYDMQGQPPTAAILDAYANKSFNEAKMRQMANADQLAQQQQFMQGAATLGQGINTLAEKKRRLAAAMTLSQSPVVQQALGGGELTHNGQAVASGPGGQPVSFGQTSNAGAPNRIPGMPDRTPNFTADQLDPLLPEGGKSDILGDAIKAKTADSQMMRYMNQNNYEQRSLDIRGRLANTAEQRANTSQQRANTYAQNPPGAAARNTPAGANEYNQLTTKRAQLIKQQASIFDPHDPRGQEIQSQIDAIDARQGELRPGSAPSAGGPPATAPGGGTPVSPQDPQFAGAFQHPQIVGAFTNLPEGGTMTIQDPQGNKHKIAKRNGQPVKLN